MHIHRCIYTYIFIYIYTYIYIHTNMNIRVCIYKYIQEYSWHVYIHLCTYTDYMYIQGLCIFYNSKYSN